MTTDPDPDFEDLLAYLKASRGFDFTGYKRSTLMRRAMKRRTEIGIDSFAGYLEHLEVHPEEFEHLFNLIMINVTRFFRDEDAWDAMIKTVFPVITAGDGPIRCWSAGCASGEEAYTLAIVLAEALGVSAFQRRVKIYATDADENALTTARHGAYTEKEVEGVDPVLLDRYFDLHGGRYVFKPDLRRSVIFGRLDLVQDAPISRIDLITCRNTLMYFNAETQGRIVSNLHFALKERGFMFLGKAEMLLSHTALFEPVDLKHRIFSKLPGGGRERIALLVRGDDDEQSEDGNRLRAAAAEVAPIPQLLVTAEGMLDSASERARALFGISPRDIGKPLHDLEISYRPLELRPRIEEAVSQGRTVIAPRVERVVPGGGSEFYTVTVVPVVDAGGAKLGASITYTDITDQQNFKSELERTNQELETASEELQSTNEELETTNEELQSTVEELETTNEELQSTNEELETMNEELQSTNAELQLINDELRERGQELLRVNEFSRSILASLRSAAAVLDDAGCVRTWNQAAEDFWGLRAEEVAGRRFDTLDFGLPVRELEKTLARALEGKTSEPVTIAAMDRRGRTFGCQVSVTPFDDGSKVLGVVVLMDRD